MPTRNKKCLIVEKHDRETGFSEEQLQILKSDCNNFFGTFRGHRDFTFEVYTDRNSRSPKYSKVISISVYKNTTYRVNRFPEIGFLPKAFVFFQETDRTDRNNKQVFEVWFEKRDMQIVIAKYRNASWRQGRSSQHGRGRLSVVVDAPVPKIINRV